jgi:hypothetical protein
MKCPRLARKAGLLVLSVGALSYLFGCSSGSSTPPPPPPVKTLKSIAVVAAKASIAEGTTEQLTATGTDSDGSADDLAGKVLTWSSSNTLVASIDSKTGLVTAKAAGTTTIQVSVTIQPSLSVVGSTVLTVTTTTVNLVGVFTQHNDNARTGQNLNETALTPSNVQMSSFGKRFSQPVDGQIYAQPLYVPNVSIAGATHNVFYVATEGDSVYAFDADSSSATLWHTSLLGPGETTGNTQNDLNSTCVDLFPQVGITSTPVIDPSTGTMYVETKSKKTNGTFVHRLHGIDITTGLEKLGTPPDIAGTAAGGSITFNALKHMNRPGLLWLNGVVYVAYASHCDSTPYYGWVFAYDAATLGQRAVWNAAPIAGNNGGLAGIWMSGAGLAADSAGNIFLPTGNGVFDTVNIPATQLGDSEVKLFYNGTTTLSLLDYFTPFDQLNLEQGDVDLGSGGLLLLPDQPGSHPHELIQAGKDGTIRVIDRDQMTTGNLHYCASNCNNRDAQIVQELFGSINGMWSMPAYWNGNVYFCAKQDNLASYALNGSGMLSTTRTHSSVHGFGYPGATPSVSANGTTNAIVWAIDTTNNGTISGGNPTQLGPAVLYVYDATNLTELYNSSKVAGDAAGNAVKFAVPTIANGKVYIGTATEVDVYGP